MITIDNYLDNHYIHRSNWLRAAVLGANDGIISISSLAIGVAAASSTREPILLATVAGLVAGALSMAAGEYVSVSSQTDTEKADIEREIKELKEMPKEELNILAQIYEKRGLKKVTAMQVAIELTEEDALGTHIRDELGINEISQANPIQAAIASGAAFTVGGVLPLLVILFAPVKGMENEGVITLEKLANFSEKEILKLHGMGKSSIPKLKDALKEKGLMFKNK